MPLSDNQTAALRQLLELVPTTVVTHYRWASPEGQRLATAIRQLNLAGITMEEIADTLGMTLGTVNYAVQSNFGKRAVTRKQREARKARDAARVLATLDEEVTDAD